MDRKTVLPDALTKGDYFRSRAPSRSPNRRPPRKGPLTGPKGADSTEPPKLTNGAVHLPQLTGSPTASDKSAERSSNGDSMTGEVTVAFIDNRKDTDAPKRKENQIHNVKIIQYVGQGKNATRANHEFWMQSETAAKFPVAQQSISSRSPLNFAFYVDGQFFHRLTVDCLNKLRTAHPIIGTKLVHFKVINVTNAILCYRCKGHEFMLASFKKGSGQTRSASLPRGRPADKLSPSPDISDKTTLRVDGASAADIKRSRSISKTRTTQPPAPAKRTATKKVAKSAIPAIPVIAAAAAGAGVLNSMNGGDGRSNGVEQVNGNSSSGNLSSGRMSREQALESYCEDRMSPVHPQLLNGDLSNGEIGELPILDAMVQHDEPQTVVHNIDSETGVPNEHVPQNVADVLGMSAEEADAVEAAEQQRQRKASETEVRDTKPKIEQVPILDAMVQHDEPETVVRDSSSEPSAQKTQPVDRDMERESFEVISPTRENAVEREYFETIPKEAYETATVPQEDESSETQVRDANGRQKTIAELTRQTTVDIETETPTEVRNVDAAEDIIELGHKTVSEDTTRIKDVPVSEEPAVTETVVRDAQPEPEVREDQSLETVVRDAQPEGDQLANVPSLAKEDVVAFEWPDANPSKALKSPSISDKENMGEFTWPDAAEPNRNTARANRVSVEILDDRRGSETEARKETPTTVKDLPEERPPSTNSQSERHAGDRRPSSPQNAEELIEELGYDIDEPEPRRTSYVDIETPTVVADATSKMPHLNLQSASFDSDTEKDRKKEPKPPSSPHTAAEMIDQLGYSD